MELTVTQVRFKSAENEWKILKCEDDDGLEQDVRGKIGEIELGDILNVTKHRIRYDENNREYIQPVEYDKVVPLRDANAYRFLKEIPGIGDVKARMLIGQYGRDVIGALDRDQESVLCAVMSKSAWRKARDAYLSFDPLMRVLMLRFGATRHLSAIIQEEYGDKAVTVMNVNPYRLIDDVDGIGFMKADMMAVNSGNFDEKSKYRLTAAVAHVLSAAAKSGDVYMWVRNTETRMNGRKVTYRGCVERTLELLGFGDDMAGQLENYLSDPRFVVMEFPRSRGVHERMKRGMIVFLKKNYDCEKEIFEMSMRLIRMEGGPKVLDEDITAVSSETKKDYDVFQKRVLKECMESGFMIVSGLPGSGKTEVSRAVVRLHEMNGKKYVIGSPTGRGAKRFTEITGYPASTIHRMLGWKGGSFTVNTENPTDADIVLIDEASMVDSRLFRHVLRSIDPDRTRLMLVGDPDQLQSIGIGDVLNAMITSFHVHLIQMEGNHRQHGREDIVRAARMIRAGRTPCGERFDLGQFDFVDFSAEPGYDKEKHGEFIQKIVSRKMDDLLKAGYDLKKDVQFITTMHRGSAGINALNKWASWIIQGNRGPRLKYGAYSYGPGDKVMQTRNDYEKDVYNGDIGWFVGHDGKTGMSKIEFGGKIREYRPHEMRDVDLAWVISVHKSQGSEFPVVVFILNGMSDTYMATRNLMYTAVTRAKRKVVFISTRRAVANALRKKKRRNSILVDWIVDGHTEHMEKVATSLPESYEYWKTDVPYRSVRIKVATFVGRNPLFVTVHNKDGIPTVVFIKSPPEDFNIRGMYDVLQYATVKADATCRELYGAMGLQRIEILLPKEKRTLHVQYGVIRKHTVTYKAYGHMAKWWVPEEFFEENGRRIGCVT